MISIQNLFRKNLPAKIFALIGAFIMWGYVMNEQNPYVTLSITVPVQGINAPESVKITYDVTEVTLKVRAPRASFGALSKSEFVAYVDLSELDGNEGELKLKTKPQNGFEIVEVSVEDIKVSIEKLSARGVPVHLALVGSTPTGTAVSAVTPASNYVNVYGTESDVYRVDRVIGNVNLSGMGSSFKVNAKLVAVDKDGKTVDNVKITPESMEVNVGIITGADNKLIPIKPNVTGDPAAGFEVGEVIAEPAQVDVVGQKEQLVTLAAVDTELISVEGLSESVVKNVKLQLPEGFVIQNRNVEVRIAIKKRELNK